MRRDNTQKVGTSFTREIVFGLKLTMTLLILFLVIEVVLNVLKGNDLSALIYICGIYIIARTSTLI